MHAAGIAIFGAAVLAVAGATFGVGMARFIWAQDLVWAQKVDAIRSQTEAHLRKQISLLEERLAQRGTDK